MMLDVRKCSYLLGSVFRDKPVKTTTEGFDVSDIFTNFGLKAEKMLISFQFHELGIEMEAQLCLWVQVFAKLVQQVRQLGKDALDRCVGSLVHKKTSEPWKKNSERLPQLFV